MWLYQQRPAAAFISSLAAAAERRTLPSAQRLAYISRFFSLQNSLDT